MARTNPLTRCFNQQLRPDPPSRLLGFRRLSESLEICLFPCLPGYNTRNETEFMEQIVPDNYYIPA